MKKTIILIAYSLAWLFIGYIISDMNTIATQNQRDRLADYIHSYEDMQENGTKTSLKEFVSDEQFADNNDHSLNLKMDIDKWYFAY